MFLLTCLLRGMTGHVIDDVTSNQVSTHMPLARHDRGSGAFWINSEVSTHMPLARHDNIFFASMVRSVFLLTCLLRGMTYGEVQNKLEISFLLTCLLRGMTGHDWNYSNTTIVSTHMPLARHDRRSR